MGRFRLSRFLPPFALHRTQHIGETITDGKGRVAYLKTFRLSDKQVRRGHVLRRWPPRLAPRRHRGGNGRSPRRN